jgi:parvulin-like peptidyl-prolyl isomerase
MRKIVIFLIAILSFQLFPPQLFYGLVAGSRPGYLNRCGGTAFISGVFAAAKIVAVVNNDAITEKDLSDSLRMTRVQLSREYKGKELDAKIESMKKDLLQQLIEQRLILQEASSILEDARKAKDTYAIFRLEVKKDKIEGQIAEIKKRYPSDEEFQNDLNKEGLTQADIENRIKEQLLTENVVDYWVKGQVAIRPEEVTDFYNKNSKEFETGEEREILVIALDNNDLATSFSYNLKAGQGLEDLATRYPITVNKLTANKNKGELRKEIDDVVFKLGLNEVSSPLNIDDKYYVFVLQNIVPSRHLSLSQAQPKVYAYLYRVKVHEQMLKWIEELKKKSYIKIMQ